MGGRLSEKELEAIREIRNSLVHRGRAPSVRGLMNSLGYRSPRSAAIILEKLARRGVIRRKSDGSIQLMKDPDSISHARTVEVPLVGAAPCGAPLLAEENIEAMIPVSLRLAKPPHRYFLLRALGDSMNKAGIRNGDLVLVRHQLTAENGDTVVALIDNEATIKSFFRGADVILLRPRSTNQRHRPIIVTEDFHIQGVVVATMPNLE